MKFLGFMFQFVCKTREPSLAIGAVFSSYIYNMLDCELRIDEYYLQLTYKLYKCMFMIVCVYV